MSNVGFVMLCHDALDRAAQVARFWASSGCPVVIHVDKKVPQKSISRMRSSLDGLSNIVFSQRYRCEWGGWGIVAATLSAAEVLLEKFSQVQHVYLVSESCLPLRHINDLKSYLEARPNTDFIQSVTTSDVGWTIGGLNEERFSLYFPFSWRRHRFLFDRAVSVQRYFNVKRGLPSGVVPHLGSQWWCLTRETISKILFNSRRREFERFFKNVWIPDESYFQTLVRYFSSNIDSRSLTLSKFDYQGRPHIFYDDHLHLLRKSECFVARKIWRNADKLYTKFLNFESLTHSQNEPSPLKIERLFSKASERRLVGRQGLYMQSRFPYERGNLLQTAASYAAFEGFSELFENFELWLGKVAPVRVHGNLFHKERVHFHDDVDVFQGGLSDSAKIRDYNPKSFLTSLIWNTRGEMQCFQLSPSDNLSIFPFLLSDPHARIYLITGAFSINLFRQNTDPVALRSEVAMLQRIESNMIQRLRDPNVKAHVKIWSLAEFIENPTEFLQMIVDDLRPRDRRQLTEFPRFSDLNGFRQFVKKLRNLGMQPVLMGDLPEHIDGLGNSSQSTGVTYGK